ncbi:sterol desaturase family protein [Zooshikella marina]|uniref:sterol desaturase family protein n=1 Tax=Zooshikella ganghwensis TaxID=202772 RepID=UPI001BAFBFFF|nr:sterol desaturase family protein [Zooshikella ganghwensis]MBU2706652.1 sterol desaturase family protein [Zooshikella ganghwensis]
MSTDFSEQLLFTLPLYLGPLFIFALIDFVRSTRGYRVNDTLTNATIALGNLGFTFILVAGIIAMYNYLYSNFSLFTLDQTSVTTWLIAFIFYDFCFYWNHRVHHAIGIFWVDHIVHHTAENFNFGVSIRNSYFMEVTMWLTFIPMALAGISIEVFLAVSYTQMTWAFLIHHKKLKHTPRLDKVFNTPSLHRVHHARNTKYIDKNFGGIFIIWDRLFGTYQTESESVPVTYGVRESIQSFSPLMINIQYLKVIIKKFTHSKTLIDKLKSIFYSPGWLPAGLTKTECLGKIADIPCKYFKPKNSPLTATMKLSCILRFIVILVVFTYLMWNFYDLPWLQTTALSCLFFWLCHYNGIVFDGVKITWKSEVLSQFLIILSGITGLGYTSVNIVSAAIIFTSFVSFICYTLHHSPPSHSRKNRLLSALTE